MQIGNRRNVLFPLVTPFFVFLIRDGGQPAIPGFTAIIKECFKTGKILRFL
jgi:hypothetical protein